MQGLRGRGGDTLCWHTHPVAAADEGAMGLIRDHQVAEVDGVRVEVKGTPTLLGGRFKLFIGGEKADEVVCNVGTRKSLRGALRPGDAERPVVVELKQGMLRTEFRLLVGGQEQPLQKLN